MPERAEAGFKGRQGPAVDARAVAELGAEQGRQGVLEHVGAVGCWEVGGRWEAHRWRRARRRR